MDNEGGFSYSSIQLRGDSECESEGESVFDWNEEDEENREDEDVKEDEEDEEDEEYEENEEDEENEENE